MNTQRLAAILLIGGFVLTIAWMFLSPPGLYQATDPQDRVQIIEAHRAVWSIGQIVVSIALTLIAIGFAVLAWGWRSEPRALIPGLGAAAFLIGTSVGIVLIYRQTVDPLGGYSGVYSNLEYFYYWLALTGLLLFGIAFVQSNLPSWIGYLSGVVALLYGIFTLLTGAGFLTPFLIALLSPVIAAVLLFAKG